MKKLESNPNKQLAFNSLEELRKELEWDKIFKYKLKQSEFIWKKSHWIGLILAYYVSRYGLDSNWITQKVRVLLKWQWMYWAGNQNEIQTLLKESKDGIAFPWMKKREKLKIYRFDGTGEDWLTSKRDDSKGHTMAVRDSFDQQILDPRSSDWIFNQSRKFNGQPIGLFDDWKKSFKVTGSVTNLWAKSYSIFEAPTLNVIASRNRHDYPKT